MNESATLLAPAPAPAGPWARAVAWAFLGTLGVMLVAAHPLSILPPGINPDNLQVRLALIAVLGLAGLAIHTQQRWWRPLRLLGGLGCWYSAFLIFQLPRGGGPGAPPDAMGIAGHPFAFTLPVLPLLAVLALPVLLARRWQPSRTLAVGSAIFGAALLLNLLRAPDYQVETLTLAAYILVPLAVCVAVQVLALRAAALSNVAGGLWLLLMVYSVFDHYYNIYTPPQAFTGNANWTAAVALATAPWAAYRLGLWLRRGLSARPAWALALLVVLSLTAYLLLRCRTRAALVATGVVLLLALWHWGRHQAPARQRALLLAGALALLLVLAGGWLLRERLAASAKVNVRGPLVQATLHLIAAHPLLGTGPGTYESSIAPYLAQTTFFQRMLAQDSAEHPHLELLNVAAQAGVPAALAWALLLLLPLLRAPDYGDPRRVLGQITALVLAVMACFDKPWTLPPASLLAVAALGLCWGDWLRPAPSGAWPAWRSASARAALLLLLVLWLGGGLWLMARETACAAHLQRAFQYDDARQPKPHSDYVHAVSHFRAAAALMPYRPVAWYGAATHTLQQLTDADLGGLSHITTAQYFLSRIAGEPPLYAHTNRLWGRSWLMAGEPGRALPWFEQELALFPQMPDAQQWALHVHGIVGDFASLPARDQATRAGLLQRRTDYSGPAWTRDQVAGWWQSTLTGQVRDAVIAGRDLIYREREKWMDSADPWSPWASSDAPWPAAFMHDEVAADDWRYWQALAWRAELLTQLQPQAAKDGWPAAITRAVQAHVKTDSDVRHVRQPTVQPFMLPPSFTRAVPADWPPSLAQVFPTPPPVAASDERHHAWYLTTNTLPFTLPHQTWQAGHGSRAAIVATCLWLAQGAGWDGVVFQRVVPDYLGPYPEQPPAMIGSMVPAALFTDGRSVVIFDPGLHDCEPLPLADLKDLEVRLIASFRLYADPVEFLTRAQYWRILGAAYLPTPAGFASHPAFGFFPAPLNGNVGAPAVAPLPIVRAVGLAAWLKTHGVTWQPGPDCILQAPIELVRAAQVPPAAPPPSAP